VVLGVMYRVKMKAMHRLATLGEAKQLFELRRKSIIGLAPKGMSVALAQHWASNLTVPGMKRKIREMEIWIVELNDTVVGWSAIHGDRLEGSYIDPEFVGRGIGTELLGVLEGLMRERGILTVRAEASSNVEEFYLRRGYEPIGLRPAEGALPIAKRIL
jgi:GNAT superfamily N-acetyltransferase